MKRERERDLNGACNVSRLRPYLEVRAQSSQLETQTKLHGQMPKLRRTSFPQKETQPHATSGGCDELTPNISEEHAPPTIYKYRHYRHSVTNTGENDGMTLVTVFSYCTPFVFFSQLEGFYG